jgi:hypothetical protein
MIFARGCSIPLDAADATVAVGTTANGVRNMDGVRVVTGIPVRSLGVLN